MTESGDLHPAVRGLKTVCRCNNVKYRTIARAIRDGAVSIHQIAARTTATTGHCGGSCTPDVEQMIDDLASKMAVPPPKTTAAGPPDAWWLRKK
jgi:NAD(P)H-nitrite reductase large subunit